jgi:hypothetical protein
MTAPRYGVWMGRFCGESHSSFQSLLQSSLSGRLRYVASVVFYSYVNFSSTGRISQVPKFDLDYCCNISTFCGGAIGVGSVDIIQCFCSKSP